MSEYYNIVSENPQSTVVAHWESQSVVAEGYQTESELEREFIDQLTRQGYTYLPIHNEQQLIANLRQQIERLNDFHFSDGEWQRFFRQEIVADGKTIADKAKTIQVDYRKELTLDNGTKRNILLINKDDIHANATQVINQYEVNNGQRPNRYDVTVLVNGLPLVHIELKKRGVAIRQAFNQIDRYGRESFWAGNALFEYVQIFVISNGTQTKYYSNTTRDGHLKERGSAMQRGKRCTSNSYEFTSYWADQTNKVLNDLTDFTATFFSRHSLLNVLTRYCILTEQNLLLAMRPYQIAATERLLNQVEKAHNARKYGTVEAGGYIWHTTGSGKTLTSFKAAQLATELPYIDKVLFVVDRKDLDYQTMKEYERFQKGAANGNTSTKMLEQQLRDSKCRIVITTIQKLSTMVKKRLDHEVFGKEVVIIFDECHRSQFGDMHRAIEKKFKKYYMFGFTGTPIFAVNMLPGSGLQKTTDDIFGRRLHTYTIVDAIRDHNVLPFRVSYVRTMAEKDDIVDEKVWNIEKERAFMNPTRIANVSRYILEHFDQQTKRSSAYAFNRLINIDEVVRDSYKKGVKEERRKERLNGFNSIFAVQSIDAARLYYDELRRQMEALPENRKLKIVTIFSFGVNDEVEGVEENSDDTTGLSQSDRDFLERAIADYNELFGTAFDTSADKFPNYYKDVSLRMKNREIDLLIVVNMFLTGFDATTLNTLWVDKNLRYHGLLQGYSRTNRILNSIKSFGNIICFRNLEEATNKALALFGDREARSTAVLRPFEDYFYGYDNDDCKHIKGYKEYVEELKERFKPGALPMGEKNERDFIRLFGSILKLRNVLACFEQFADLDPLTERELQDYMSIYIDLHDKYINQERHDATDISDDVEFEMELVKQVEVNIDYILFLVEKYHESNCSDVEIRVKIIKAIDSSPDLRDKKELITQFIDSITPTSDVDEEWRLYVNAKKVEEYKTLIEREHLKRDKAIRFMETAFDRGYVPEGGVEINDIMPPMNPFDRSANRIGIFNRVLEELKAFFAKYFEIADGNFTDTVNTDTSED